MTTDLPETVRFEALAHIDYRVEGAEIPILSLRSALDQGLNGLR